MKTVIGYHDKNKGTHKLFTDKLPVLVDERFSPFAMTTRQFLDTNTHSIITRLQAIPIESAIKRFKTILGTILLIPGTITAILYILDFLSAVAQTSPPPIRIPVSITNFTFWIAVWGAMILWHETYRRFRIKEKIEQSDMLTEHDIKSIKQGELGLSKLTTLDICSILAEDTLEHLHDSLEEGQINSLTLLEELLLNKNCRLILHKLALHEITEDLSNHGINEKSLPKYSPSAIRSLLVYAAEEAILTNSATINPEHLFVSLFKVFPALNHYLRKQKLNVDLMRSVIQWLRIKEENLQSTRTFDPDIPYYRSGGIGQLWVFGYTYILSHYSKDLNEQMARKGGRYGIGHDSEIEEILSILSKVSKNNVLLIGESGTGKSSIAKGIAGRINRGAIPASMKHMRIIQLDINGLIAAAPQFGNLESLVKATMDELQKAGNTILYIDEIQEIVPAKGKESQHSLAGILLPYVLESKFPIIGTITYADYKRFFYSRESLRQSFQTVEIKEVTPEAAFEILLTRLEELEKIYNLEITFPALLAAIELAQRYVYDRKLPDSAVNTIESACASQQNSGNRILTAADVARTVATQTAIPVEEITSDEATHLLKLEEKIRSKVIGQDEAVHQIVEALKRARTGIRDPKRPIGTFLFLGPTGVGKTHISKTISQEYFGEKSQLIRLDMSEYKEVSSIERLLGKSEISETTQSAVSFLDQVKQRPFSVVLLDELEKAHPQILDLFLQVLDDGRLTSATGETVNFSNTIIIATSNIGSKTLLESLEVDNTMFEEAKDRVLLELRQKIRVEFLNRFDKVIVFKPHDQTNLAKIAELLLKELKSRMLEKEITIKWDESIPRIIAHDSFEPGLGARPQRRYIQEKVEGIIASAMLEGQLKPGDAMTITPQMLRPSGHISGEVDQTISPALTA